MRSAKWRLSTVVHTLSAAALLASVACSGGNGAKDASDSAANVPTGRAFRVALLTPGPISDQSWNGGAYQGLMRVRDSLGAQVSHIQTKTPAEFEENFRQYGAQGYDLVIGHGFEFQDAALRVAPEYPKTVFVTTSGTSTAKNVAGIEFNFEDASYLAGMAAGALTKSNKLGAIGGTELPPVKRSFEAFAKGAKSVNPNAETIVSYVGNWDDVSAAKEQALAHIGRGVDVIYQNADAAGLGIFQAVRESKGVYVIGSNSNQNSVAPEVTVGSVVIDLPHAFLLTAREVKDRKFMPRVIRFGGESEVVRLIMNPVMNKLPVPAKAAIDSVTRAMNAGTFKIQ
jgi:basic membrane protein A and related proteins